MNVLTDSFQLPTPEGELEVLVQLPAVMPAVMMIMCHPHPLFGGTMHNKVVTTVAKACQELNIGCIRFNFRGVGKSTGSHNEGIGEVDDLLAVIHWVQQTYPQSRLWLAGFSFGAYIAAKVAASGIGEQLLSIAPPSTRWHFQDIIQMPCPWLVIQGDADEVIEATAVFNWFANQHPHATVIRMEGASHFFHGRLLELKQHIINYLSIL